MNILDVILNASLVHVLGWTLVHFLWQGAVVGAAYAVLRSLLSGKSPIARYRLAMGTLAILAILPVITFTHLSHTFAGAATNAVLPPLSSLAAGVTQSLPTPLPLYDSLKIWLQPLVPWAVPLWLLGVAFMTLRIAHGWRHTRLLRKTASFLPLLEWNAVVESLCRTLGIRKRVRLAVSARVAVPSVIGWLRPLILIPPSAIAGLTPAQMELILVHELAHICRQDYFWNLLQVMMETLLFYHPVVRWISRDARIEREQCCDDMVVGLRGNALDYARALTELESLRHPRSALLLGADGGQVMDRIYRVVGLPTPNTPVSWLPLLLGTGLLCAIGLMQLARQGIPHPPVFVAQYPVPAKAEALIARSQKPPVLALAPTRLLPAASVPPTAPLVPVLTAPHLASTNFPIAPLALPVNAPAVPASPPEATSESVGVEVIARYTPVYPALALERGIEGSATVAFTVTSEGHVTDAHVTQETGSRLFGEAAMEALHRWKFAPATVAGVPVNQQLTQQFSFQLHSSDTGTGACKVPMGYHVCMPN